MFEYDDDDYIAEDRNVINGWVQRAPRLDELDQEDDAS